MNIDFDRLFEELSIDIKKGREAQFFFGDNLDGYFEGHTHAYAKGNGYFVRQRAVYRDFLSWTGDRLNDRELAEGARIFPYGVRHLHGPTWWDEFMLLHRRRAVALRMYSRRPMSLALAPMLDWRTDLVSVHQVDGAMLITHEKASVHVAVSSSQPFRHDGFHKHERYCTPVFRTAQPEQEFTLYVAFARDPEQALKQARMLRESDGVKSHKTGIFNFLTKSNVWTSDMDYNRAVAWAKLTSYFMVVDEYGKGIWAGLPWFNNNWGRDTFIALSGTLLVSGMFEDAKDVFRTFLRWQNTDKKSKNYGRVPNRVCGPQDIIYNTTDGTPWLLREIDEYLGYTGDIAFAEEVHPAVKLALEGAIKNFADKKGFLTHDDADTWMDARIEGNLPWSARGNRANDIQVLWHAALLAGARLAELAKDKKSAKAWRDLAATLKKNFPKLFWDPKKKRMADRVREDNSQDFKVRPNQLMLVSVPLDGPFVDEAIEEKVVQNAIGELLYPHGIGSLSQNDPYFHPVHHNDEMHHFDAPYHNGIVWGWNAGFAVTAMCRHGQTELAWKLAQNLADQILNLGCRGAMSELVDAYPDKKGKLVLSGTWAQAWSTSEFTRNAYQDFGGFRPRLMDDVILFEPHVPEDWTNYSATYPFGRGAQFHVAFTRQHGKEVFILRLEGHTRPLNVKMRIPAFGNAYTIDQSMKAADTVMVVIDPKGATVGVNAKWNPKPVKGSKLPKIKPLAFVKPATKAKPKSLTEKHYLQKIIEAGKFR